MKLQAASKKEISRIAVGTLVCDVIMVAGLFLLSQFASVSLRFRAFCWARRAAPW